ncbi:cancer/testis antigen 47A-like [Arvicola amphibius]|uniref:cancer/testis antigen 47A-like n=1 Tax=Arvicola amphibius TaxID=1047088 RepID=UPI001C0976D2|nr:cancer/testis antigen 47A-like [Arvicola amphibius]XP_038171791.2 cancer/testis antigen 47A-like [Arvicola amphibius]XP_038171792.2 cancer/testis antigen 47A-like [Arvicola amphibius]
MSATGDQDPTRETRDDPVALEGEWLQEAAGGSEIGHESGLNGASATPAIEEMMAVHPRGMDNAGPERNQEEGGDRRESSDAEEDSDIEPVDEEGGEEEMENLGDREAVEDHRFPMAAFRFIFLDVIHAILNRVYYNDHASMGNPRENDGAIETPGPSASGHSSEVQVPSGPLPSTVTAAGYGCQAPYTAGRARSLPEIISTFPELEEPPDFEEEADHYLPEPHLCMREPAVRAAAKEQAGEEMAAQAATTEEPKREVIEQAMTSEGKETSSRGLDEEIGAGQRLGGRK